MKSIAARVTDRYVQLRDILLTFHDDTISVAKLFRPQFITLLVVGYLAGVVASIVWTVIL